MATGEGSSKDSGKVSIFDDTEYVFWKKRMQIYVGSLGYDVWQSVVNGYTEPTTPLTDNEAKKAYGNNLRALNAIMLGLSKDVMAKVMDCNTAKKVWDRLKNIYKGDAKIKKAKLQIFRAQFESLKMTEEEDIDSYMVRVNEVVNSIRGVGETLENSVVCQKILRSVLPRYDSKVSTNEEAKDLDTITLDEVYGTLKTYEMRTEKGKLIVKQAAFKATKKLKLKEQFESEEEEDSDDDEVIVHFTRKLKKGTGKYKDKLPFKCFNCGKVGNFASKCPHKGKIESDDDEEDKRSKVKGKKKYVSHKTKKFKPKKRSFISKKSIDTSKEEFENDSDDVDDHAMFMVFEEKENGSPRTSITSEDEEEGEVDFEAELRSALKELKKERKKLKKQADESRKILEDLEEKLSQKTTECTNLESKNLSLKAKLEEESNILAEYSDFQKEIDALKAKVAEFENDSSIHDIEISSQVHPSSKKLDEILSSQRSTHNKFGLRFVGESSKSTKGKGKGTAQNPITVKDKRVEKDQTPPHKANHRSYNRDRQGNARSIKVTKPKKQIPREKQLQKPQSINRVWVQKSNAEKGNSSMVVQTAFRAQGDSTLWILDSGCLSHMTGDKKRFEKFETYAGGSMKFGNNDGAKIVGKGTISLNNGKVQSQDVLYVEGLKHNLLSISQICDRGHEVVFKSEIGDMKWCLIARAVKLEEQAQGS
ncbi:uncharacterized protein LOC122662937 [Telopea speciosissima]|uniref:uncharacterized protein LOC122662937 n=1 Tax=Telopea speciosissima TaxID=54955 RepID=UPI001CC54318|nr:uncharacterized protein LOC122662937 [Telopea speciosissima]